MDGDLDGDGGTIEDGSGISYSHRVCRRCGAEMERVRRARSGDVWRCPNADTHRFVRSGHR